MKHINTTATALNKIKSQAKKIKIEQEITQAEALEIAAKQAGYDNFHHASTCAAKTSEDKKTALLGSLKYALRESEYIAEFTVSDEESLDLVTDELDELVLALNGGFKDMTLMDDEALEEIIETCQKLVKREPAFLDGYAHWIGALVALENHKEAVKVGEPIVNTVIDLIKDLSKDYYLNYYCLANRPFFRLTHNMVLALYGAGKNKEANKLAKNVLKVWPNDNVGFRFLLSPPQDY